MRAALGGLGSPSLCHVSGVRHALCLPSGAVPCYVMDGECQDCSGLSGLACSMLYSTPRLTPFLVQPGPSKLHADMLVVHYRTGGIWNAKAVGLAVRRMSVFSPASP